MKIRKTISTPLIIVGSIFVFVTISKAQNNPKRESPATQMHADSIKYELGTIAPSDPSEDNQPLNSESEDGSDGQTKIDTKAIGGFDKEKLKKTDTSPKGNKPLKDKLQEEKKE